MMQYLISAALMLAGCLSFYMIFLKKETFYMLNRWVLIGCLLLSFGLPLIKVPGSLSLRDNAMLSMLQKPEPFVDINDSLQQFNSLDSAAFAQSVAAGFKKNDSVAKEAKKAAPVQVVKQNDNAQAPSSFSWEKAKTWIVYLYWFGVAAFILNFIVQLILLLKRACSLPFIQDGKFRIVELSGDDAPCSFGNIIFINPSKYDWDTYTQIIEHEKIHINQHHTIDIVLSEIVIAFQWFNPFAWLYRKEVETNLEFLTDDQMINGKSVEKQSYQMSILRVSAPQMPLSLTTNYNQSLIKKRITMMNAKRSNINTAWKYVFMFPLLAVLASLLNEPIVTAQTPSTDEAKLVQKDLSERNLVENAKRTDGFKKEGVFFATIKNDKISIQFKSDETENGSSNMTSVPLSELSAAIKDGTNEFSLKREAGEMNFKGKFEDGNGMGRYKFSENAEYKSTIAAALNDEITEEDMFSFFFVNLKTSYVAMTKKMGFAELNKHDLIAMSALNINEQFINSWKQGGFKDISAQELISLQALQVDHKYFDEIRNAGFKDLSIEQLISFKAQGVDGNYIGKVMKENDGLKSLKEVTPDDMISMKAMQVDGAYLKEMNSTGLEDLNMSMLVAMKSQGINSEYVNSFKSLNLQKINSSDIVALKSLNVTPAFIKELQALGYQGPVDDFVMAKSLGITAAYAKGFRDAGYPVPSLSELGAMKSQNIELKTLTDYKKLGFENVPVGELMSARAMGVTPEFITEMRAKGHNLKSLQKYALLKNAID